MLYLIYQEKLPIIIPNHFSSKNDNTSFQFEFSSSMSDYGMDKSSPMSDQMLMLPTACSAPSMLNPVCADLQQNISNGFLATSAFHPMAQVAQMPTIAYTPGLISPDASNPYLQGQTLPNWSHGLVIELLRLLLNILRQSKVSVF